MITIAVNLKKYFEKFRDKQFNKKHKGVKKDAQGMNFEAYAERIMNLREYQQVSKKPKKIIPRIYFFSMQVFFHNHSRITEL